MIIEAINIKNIRSIKSLELKLPRSTMLFFGDVGSGKSSVLKALEFGLFGSMSAADLRGESLLRRGENRASVEIAFSIDGKRFKIFRGLSKIKKDKISQTKGYLIEDNEKTAYAPTDLRRKILELLNYSIPRYEHANKIPLFRFTVYTPQESIKEILEAKPEDRFEILKMIFGIEKYETAIKNVKILGTFLNETTTTIRVRLEDIGNPEDFIDGTEQEIKTYQKKIKGFKDELKKREKEVSDEQAKLDDIQKQLTKYSKELAIVLSKGKEIKEDKSTINNKTKDLEALKKEIGQTENNIKDLPQISLEVKLTEKKTREKIKSLETKVAKQREEKGAIESKVSNIDKLLKEGKCALCGQKVHEQKRFEKELNEAKDTLDKYTKSIDSFQNEIRILREYKEVEAKKQSLTTLLEEKHKRKNDLVQNISDLTQKITKNEKSIEKALISYKVNSIKELQTYEDAINKDLKTQKTKVDQLTSEKNDIEKQVTIGEGELGDLKAYLQGLHEAIEAKKKLQSQLAYTIQVKNWVLADFPGLLRDIEKQILSSSARHFNAFFREWFKILIQEENLEVQIRPDNFQPEVYVDGYESPFRDLSGGEKSAVSLSYRLALNKIINERYQEVKTKDLLILDEPTDGFSQEQVSRMQEVFNRLNTSQMIIISHERTLDSFVAEIFNFTKEHHTTKIIKE